MIVIDEVSRIYNKKNAQHAVVALDTVSLTIPDRSFVSISGRSGSGKSTLLHLIGGVDRPTSGTISINNINTASLSDLELADFRNRTVGFVFQSFLLEPSLSALENVELPLLLRNISKHKRRKMAVEMLEQAGLGHRINHKPYELSGGEKQRVSIARALVTSPKILLADEPTGNLDEETGNGILALMRSMTSDCTFILVTHDESQARLASIQILMKDGKIVSDHCTQEVWRYG